MKPLTDTSQLARSAKSGDKDAISQLLRICWSNAFKIVSRYIKGYDDISDICQESVIRLYHNLEQYQTSKSFDPWFRKIVFSLTIDYLRKKARCQTVEITPDIPGSSPGPEVKLIYSRVITAAYTLSKKDHRIFILRWLFGLRCNDIAEYMNIRSNEVSKRSRAALATVRQIIKGEIARVPRDH